MRLEKPSLLPVLIALLSLVSFAGCGSPGEAAGPRPDDHFRNVYVVFVYSFYDSDGDGVGDLQGLIKRLDYISCPETGLGADAIWMLPVHPAVSYHMYDVTDYMDINPLYGTLDDFDRLIAAANERGVTIILDLILNHTAAAHPWFLAALTEIREELPRHYFYYYNIVYGRPPGGGWYSAGRGYYFEGDFWSGMPDLNFNNPMVKREFEEIARFWIERGVHGFRLDAAKHVFRTERENHEFWAWFADMARGIDPDIFLVAEVWDTEHVIMPYYETGLDSLFNFRFQGADGIINQALRLQNAAPLVAQIERTDRLIRGRNPNAMDSVFLSNHDTNRSADWIRTEEERKLAAAIYLLIPGVSYIYYGEEISMTGSGIDENKRAPMLWTAEHQIGQTRGPLRMTRRPLLAEGAAEALARPHSLLNYYRAVLAAKNRHPEIARGRPTAIQTDAPALGVYEVEWNGGRVIVAHNLSEESVTAEVDLGSRVSIAERLNPNCLEGSGFGWNGTALTLPRRGTAILRQRG